MASFVSMYAEIILFPDETLGQQAWCASVGMKSNGVIAHYSDRKHTHVLLHLRTLKELSEWTQSLHSSNIRHVFFSHHVNQIEHCMARIKKQKAYHEWVDVKDELNNLADFYEWNIDDTRIGQLLGVSSLERKKRQGPPHTPFGGAN
jgi:hypothetical protein